MKTIIVGGKKLELHAVKGTVLSSEKHFVTSISGGGGGSYYGTGGTAPVSVTSRTIIHDQVFLLDNAGMEHAFQLRDFNIACREGNVLSVILAIKTGKSKGHYVAVINHDTRQIAFNEDSLKRAGSPNVLKVALGMLAITILGFKISNEDFEAFMGVFTVAEVFGLLGYAFVVLKRNMKQIRSAITLTDF